MLPFGLWARIKRRVARTVSWHPPLGVRAGRKSFIERPRRIDGPQYIAMGDRSSIGKFCWVGALNSYAGISYSPKIVLGDDVHIGRYVCITAINSVVIENGCLLSEHVYISDHAHSINPEHGLLADRPLVSKGRVLIGADTFVGYRACILPGVTLGRGCVVGANSVVTRSFPDYSMIAGCPARLIKTYSQELKAWSSQLEGVTFA
jgi:acetyltransferase-like isoleucine patch superfamily enzyme